MGDKLYPAFEGNNVPILFSSNNSFVPYVAIMIQSILDHASENHNYDIIILHSEISEQNMQQLMGMIRNYQNVSIRFFDVSPLCGNYQLYTGIKDGRLTQESYYRLLAGQILSEEYERAIYLDGDMVTLVDIAQLNEIDIDGKYLAAAWDVTGVSYSHAPGNDLLAYRTNTLKLKEPDNYFISGLLVLNLVTLKRDFPGDKLMKLAASRDWRQHDQDVLNVICSGGHAKLLHAAWNVLQDYGNNRFLPKPLLQEWLESEQEPYVLHYGGSGKPWKKDVVRQEYFWRTAAHTPFFETIVFQMVCAEQKYTEEEMEQLHTDIQCVQQRIMSGEVKPERNQILAELAKMEGERRTSTPECPLISVIITVYKVEPYLEKCIESVINQTYQNLEIILVDDGSPDHCGAICDRYAAQDGRIRVIHKPNGGVSSARNAGLAAASGDYIGWVDGDDWIGIDMYEYLIEGAKRYRTPVVICGFVNVQKSEYTSRYRKANQTLTTQEALRQLFNFEVRNYLCDRIWERSIFDGITFEDGVLFEDTRVTYRLFERARWITFLKQGKYYRLLREDSIVTTQSFSNKLQACQANIIRYQDIRERWTALLPIHLTECYRAIQRMRDVIVISSVKEYRLYAPEIREIALYLQENYKATLDALQVGRLGKLELFFIAKGKRITFFLSRLPIKLLALKEKFKRFQGNFKKKKLKNRLKGLAQKLFPAYHVSLRLEKKIMEVHTSVKSKKSAVDSKVETIFWLQNARADETMEETKKRVFLNMPRWGGEVSILQEGNLLLLKKLKEMCDEHGITFWMVGGTLLGAVRHKGFIPWDDDIDIGMLRNEVEKLAQVVEKYPEIKLERYYHSPGPWQTIKLVFADENSPFWVDILLYDYAGDRRTSPDLLWKSIQNIRKKTTAKLKNSKKKLKLTYRDDIIFDQKDCEIVDQIFDTALLTLPTVFHRDYIYRSIDCVCGKWQQLFPCERMMPFCELEFEGDYYLAPKDYEWYLQLQYGDYWTIPGDVGHTHTRFTEGKMEHAEDVLENLKINL